MYGGVAVLDAEAEAINRSRPLAGCPDQRLHERPAVPAATLSRQHAKGQLGDVRRDEAVPGLVLGQAPRPDRADRLAGVGLVDDPEVALAGPADEVARGVRVDDELLDSEPLLAVSVVRLQQDTPEEVGVAGDGGTDGHWRPSGRERDGAADDKRPSTGQATGFDAEEIRQTVGARIQGRPGRCWLVCWWLCLVAHWAW